MRRISGENGGLDWSRDYYPFGETREASGANEDNLYTYEGKEKDLETNSWNNWKRHFNDEGRFMQVDPLWSKYPSLSPYVRVANNPLRFVDEDGRKIINAETKQEMRENEVVQSLGNSIREYYNTGQSKVNFIGQFTMSEQLTSLFGVSINDHSHGHNLGTLKLGKAIGVPSNAFIVNTKGVGKLNDRSIVDVIARVVTYAGKTTRIDGKVQYELLGTNSNDDISFRISGDKETVQTAIKELGISDLIEFTEKENEE